MRGRLNLLVLGAFLAGGCAFAQVPLSGSFLARKSCPALQSIKKNSNPGNMTVEAGRGYRLLGKNKETASHYWIEVPGAVPAERWVDIACGSIDGQPRDSTGGAPPATPRASDEKLPLYVLALSWEPAFCEGLPDKAECRDQTAASFSATHWSLHGLWPQPRRNAYCGVGQSLIAADDAHRWEDLPEPDLPQATRTALAEAMPGTRSLLERHEWIRHGTCYPGGSADTYFKDAIRAIEAVNASPVQELLARNVGKTVSGADLRNMFDEAFGQGAGDRVRIACKRDGERQLISEITVGLRGDVSAGTPLAELIAAAPATDPGCPEGIVDAVGLQ